MQRSHFTTELIKGQNLYEWINNNHNPNINIVQGYVEQIASALRAMHRQDVIHQDLKPDNIMINEHNRIKIIDFGAVHAAGLAEISSILERQQPEGTANYTAPEYFMESKGSKRSDIFSLSVITYELLTGHLPFKEKTFNKFQLRSYEHMKYISIKKHRPDIPTWLDNALKKGCSANPAKRYGLLSEFIHDLKTPKDSFINADDEPLMQRNPVLLWQGISAILVIILIVSISLNNY